MKVDKTAHAAREFRARRRKCCWCWMRRLARTASQAREFMGVAGVNGIVFVLDGMAKCGVAVAIAHDLKLPIRFVGVGEGIDDLVPFSADEYVDGLFEEKW
jgi:hypothetical protein